MTPADDQSPIRINGAVNELCELVNGSLVPWEDGSMRFISYDRTATADRVFSAYEISDFEQGDDPHQDVANYISVYGRAQLICSAIFCASAHSRVPGRPILSGW
jgi:hypothetical protein